MYHYCTCKDKKNLRYIPTKVKDDKCLRCGYYAVSFNELLDSEYLMYKVLNNHDSHKMNKQLWNRYHRNKGMQGEVK